MVVFAVFFGCFSITVYADNSYEESKAISADDITNLEQLGVAQADALRAFFQFIRNYTADGRFIWPEGYGGCYIDSQNTLVFQVKEGCEQLKQDILEHVDDELPIEVRFCDYSLSELQEVADMLLSEGNTSNIHISASFLYDIERNMVEIYILESEDGDVEEVSNRIENIIMDSDIPATCEIEESINSESDVSDSELFVGTDEGIVPLASSISLVGGSTLYKYNGSSYSVAATLGFSGTYSGRTAYVTAGHVVSGGQYYLRASSTINDAISYNYPTPVYGTSGDYGIVKVSSSSYSIGKSSYVKTGTNSTGAVAYYYDVSDELPAGTYIYKYGYTTGLTVGVYRVGTYHSYTDGHTNVSVGGLAAFGNVDGNTSVLGDNGDSGGPVWCINGNSRVLLGLYSGENSSSYIYYYQPIKNVVSAGFSPYGLTELDPDDF